MSYEVNQVIETLKQLLKEKGFRQADVGAVLNLGEARVKQMFGKNDFHKNRLVAVCNELLDMELADLVQIIQDRQNYIEQLTKKQEK